MAKWWSQDPRTKEWGLYDPADTKLLEASWNGSKAPVTLDFGGMSFTVDLKTMIQKNSTGGSRPVKREGPAAPAGDTVKFIESHIDTNIDALTLDEFEKFFGDLGIDMAGIEPFVFFWKIGAKGTWSATKQELIDGMAAHALTPKTAKPTVDKWVRDVSSNINDFKECFQFAFMFSRNSTSASVIPVEECKDTMLLFLKKLPQKPKFSVEKAVGYLEGRGKPINKDHWKEAMRFVLAMDAKCTGYDDQCFNSVFDDLAEQCTKA